MDARWIHNCMLETVKRWISTIISLSCKFFLIAQFYDMLPQQLLSQKCISILQLCKDCYNCATVGKLHECLLEHRKEGSDVHRNGWMDWPEMGLMALAQTISYPPSQALWAITDQLGLAPAIWLVPVRVDPLWLLGFTLRRPPAAKFFSMECSVAHTT